MSSRYTVSEEGPLLVGFNRASSLERLPITPRLSVSLVEFYVLLLGYLIALSH